MSIKYDILNDGGNISGQLGLGWTAYAMDDHGNVWPAAHVDSTSSSTNDQLTALYNLYGKILSVDPNVLLRDMTITGESLSLADTTQSPVKQWIISEMKQP